MEKIYILTVNTEDDSFIMPFTTQEKAIAFIINNFESDKPRKVTNELFEGKTNHYVIEDLAVDQVRF